MADITTNADFLLTVGVDVGLSLEPMQKGLEELVKQLNSKPLLIKFEADTSSMEAQIAKVTGSDSSGKKRQSNAKQTSQAYKEATQAINQYYAKLKQLSLAEKEAFDTYKTTGKTDAKYSSLIAELNHLKTAYDNAIASKNSMTAAEQTEITTLDTMQQLELASAVERRTNAILQNTAAMTSSETVMSQANATLARCTKAEHSHKQSSRDAVAAIRQKISAVVQAQNAVKAGSATDEEAAAKVRVLQEVTKDLRLSLKENYAIIQQNGDATKGLGERLVGLGKKFTQWFGVSQLIMAAYRAIRKMITAVIELDTAMTELKKVTDETDETYRRFLENAATRAKKLGASLTDVVKTTADFARLGFSLEDAEVVSDAALVYKNVGDGIEDIDQASESLISTMQAFGIEAKDVMSIVDKFNITGNKFAISSGGVGDALLNSAAALNAAGNSLDESIGLITAANTTIQNPEKVGTALKTVSMYLRAAKTEAEDAGESTEGMANSVSELRGEILALTGNKVDIQINDDEFKSTYQILKELSEVWDELSDISKANITEMIGGKRNANVISALLKDFEKAEAVVTQTASSSGSAMAENEKVLESIQGKLNILSATFETFSQNLIGSDTVKFFVDFATGVLSVLDAFARLNTLLPAVIGNFLLFKAVGIAKNLADMKAQVSVLTQSLVTKKNTTKELTAAVYGLTLAEKQELVTQLEQAVTDGLINETEKNLILTKLGLTGATTSLTVANKGLAASFKSVMASVPVWGWIALAITVVIEAITAVVSWVDASTKSVQELEEEYKNLHNTITQTAQSFRSLKTSADEIIPRYAKLAQGVTKFGEQGTLTNEEYAEFVGLNNQLGELFPDLVKGYDSNGNAILALAGNVDTLTASLYECVKVQQQAAAQEIADTMPDVLENIDETTEAYEKQIKKLKTQRKQLKEFYEHLNSGGAPSKAQKQGYYYDTLTEGDRKQFYDEFGVSVERYEVEKPNYNPRSNTARTDVKFKYVFDESNLQENYENADLIIDKQIKAIEDKINAKNKQLNPVVRAWLQTDFIYADLNTTMQGIADAMVSGVDFAALGLKTKEQVEEYIHDNILDPLFNSDEDVKNAFETSFALLESGLIDEDEFSKRITEAFDKLKEGMSDEEWEKFSQHFVDGFNEMGIEGENFASVANNLIDNWTGMSDAADETATSVSNLKNALSDLNSLSTGLEKLDKIYSDIFDKEDFDYAALLDEGFTKAFGDLDKYDNAYSNFIDTVANSPKDINACQEAFNNLATAYITESGILSDVNDKTRDLTVAYLEQMGVANAAALVDEQLAIAKEKTRIATEAGSNATYNQILDLYDEETASRITAQAIYELAIAKIQTNENALLTSSDIAQLEALAEAAGATAESLLNVAKAKSYITQAEALEKQKADLIAKGADPRGISVVSTQAANYRLWAEELLNKKITYEVDFKRASYTGGSSTKSARSSAAKAAEKEAKEAETWFERQLKDHQHLVAMEQETEAEYLAWLNKAYKQAYNEGIIELDDYYKYQEEIYEGLRDLFMDSLGDVEHEISMRENYDGEEKKIIALYQGLMKDVEKEIAAARAQGLTDEDDYIQELQEKWQDYANAIKDIREEIEEAAKDALDEMIDYRVDMLKQEIEDEKDVLDKKLDNLKEFYDKQKEMLQDKYDEEKYLEDQAEKRKSVSDIKGELAMLENDDSAWAQKRKLELTEELTDAEKDLADFEKENALDKALDAIDEAYNSQEAQLQREMDALDEKLNDPNALFNQALEDIKNNSKNQLYYQMLMYNRQYGDGNDETVKKLWEDTYGALNDYEKLFGKLYKGVDLKNETGVKDDKGWDDEKVSGTNPDNKPKDPPKTTTTTTTTQSTAPSLSSGSTVTIKKTATHFGSKSKGVKMASFVPGGSYTVYQTSGNQVLIGRNGVYTGWVNKSDIVGYASGTKHATAGLHELFEQGDEYIFSASDGSRYRMFSGGEKVLNAKATEFLYNFANSGGDVLAQMLRNVFGGTGLDGITPTVINNEINMGDIIVQGSANERTVSEIRRAQRESVDFMLKEFTKLNK